MASAVDLIIVFLGLETLSLSVYVLAGYFRNNARSNESALKYFLLGAFSTGFLLYGIAMIYGATGTTNLKKILPVPGPGPSLQSPLMLLDGRKPYRRFRIQGGFRPLPHVDSGRL